MNKDFIVMFLIVIAFSLFNFIIGFDIGFRAGKNCVYEQAVENGCGNWNQTLNKEFTWYDE